MELNTRTVYSADLQTNLLLELPHVIVPFTTLNERFDIQAGIPPTLGDYPHMGYMAIGNGGHRMVVGAGGLSKPEPIQHEATDAAPYSPIPFVLRLPAEDLTSAERINYALRKEVTFQGLTYIAYYLRRIDLSGVSTQMEYRTVQDGQTVVTPFVPNNSNLNPTPPDITNSGVNVTTGDYVTASAKVTISLTAWEATELLNVAKVMYDDESYAIVSEIALVTGVDKVVPVSGPTGSFNFNEVIAAQCASFIAAFYAIRFSQQGIDINLDVGASEPLFRLVPTTPMVTP